MINKEASQVQTAGKSTTAITLAPPEEKTADELAIRGCMLIALSMPHPLLC